MDKQFCYKYPRPAVTTDCVVFGLDDETLNVLLIERGGEPFKGCWAFPGGFLNMDETAEEGAARELQEETSLRDIFLEQVQAFSEVHRDPRGRVISIAFYALVHQGNCTVKGGDDAAKAVWFPLSKLPALAFDHHQILQTAIRHLKAKIRLEPEDLSVNTAFSPAVLQDIYKKLP